MYRGLSLFYPEKIREGYKKLLTYSSLKINPSKFMGFVLFFGLGLSLAASLFLSRLIGMPFPLLFVILFIGIEFLIYVYLLLGIDAKAKFVEDVLPDALQLMASNLKSGLTTDKALLLSARPEFGPLKEEINLVGKEIAMGKDVDKALLLMSSHIKSEKLEKTVFLINSGIRSGGQLAALLEQTAKNLRQQRLVDDKIRANVMMYVIFIFAAVGFGSPLLFGLSTFLTEVLTKNIGMVEIPQGAAASMPITLSTISVSISFIIKFAITSLITTSIMGSLVIGLISKGKEKQGIKFIPMLIALTLFIFFAVRFMIKNLLSGLFGL
tara:strand:+ start:33 stop:1004 length:972 start_codon:yes stop_codon:yes gene_type:complete